MTELAYDALRLMLILVPCGAIAALVAPHLPGADTDGDN